MDKLVATRVLLERVYKIHVPAWGEEGSYHGTGFIMFYEKNVYLVTARHVIPDAEIMDLSGIVRNTGIAKLPLTWIGSGKGASDVSVMRVLDTSRFDFPRSNFVIPMNSAGRILGEDVLFLGYPLSVGTSGISNINRGFPLPLVHKGIYSCSLLYNGDPCFWIHANADVGISGGPVIAINNSPELKSTGVNYNVIGVIFSMTMESSGLSQEGDDIQIPTGFVGAIRIEEVLDIIDGYFKVRSDT